MSASQAFQSSIDRYHELIHQSPNDIGLLTNLAWSYERAGQYPEAIQQFHRALDLSPNDVNALYGLALALMGNGQNQEAIEAFVRARDLAVSEGTDRSHMVILSKQVEVYLHRLQGG